jgi:hypothetical protein
MELSVNECMNQYCHESFLGGGHSLCFGKSKETKMPIPKRISRTIVNPKINNWILISTKDMPFLR